MATDEKFTVGYNRKVQLDQFEPVQVLGELEVSLEDGDVFEDEFASAEDRVEDAVERELSARIARKKMESQENDGG